MISHDEFVDWVVKQNPEWLKDFGSKMVSLAATFLAKTENSKFSNISAIIEEAVSDTSVVQAVTNQKDAIGIYLENIYNSQNSEEDLYHLEVLQVLEFFTAFVLTTTRNNAELGAEALFRSVEYSKNVNIQQAVLDHLQTGTTQTENIFDLLYATL